MTKPTGKPAGRPGKGITERMLLPLPPDMKAAIKAAADSAGLASTEWIRVAIEEKLARTKPARAKKVAKKS